MTTLKTINTTMPASSAVSAAPVAQGCLPSSDLSSGYTGADFEPPPQSLGISCINAGLLTPSQSEGELVGALDDLLSSGGSVRGEVAQQADVAIELGATMGGLAVSVQLLSDDVARLRGLSTLCGAVATGRGDFQAAQAGVSNLVQEMVARGDAPTETDVMSLVQWVLRESYLETTQDLSYHAEKVKFFNEQKKAIREQLGKWREIRAALSGVSEDEKANTRLDGSTIAKGTAGESAADGGDPVIESAEQRALDYPEGYIELAGFLPFLEGHVVPTGGSGGIDVDGGPLEAYLTSDPQAWGRLLAAIPYMTAEEVGQLVAALGGADGNVGLPDVEHPWSEIVNAMTPQQLLDLRAYYPGIEAYGEFGTLMENRANTVKAKVETETGSPCDWLAAAKAHRDARKESVRQAQAEEAKTEAGDASAADAILELCLDNPNRTLTAEEVATLLREGSADLDGQAAGQEFTDFVKFIEKNLHRLSPGAAKVWDAYNACASEASASGSTGIPTDDWDAMMEEIDAIVSEHADEDAALVAAEEERAARLAAERLEAGKIKGDHAWRFAEDLLGRSASDIDNDPSDGSIDNVMLNENAPPFLIRHPAGKRITTVAELEAAMDNLEDKLSSVGDDAQLANVDLQNVLQKQQQTIQMMSNIAKTLHDTAMAVIRKISG